MSDTISETALIPYRRVLSSFDQYTNNQILNTDKGKKKWTSATSDVI